MWFAIPIGSTFIVVCTHTYAKYSLFVSVVVVGNNEVVHSTKKIKRKRKKNVMSGKKECRKKCTVTSGK